MSLNNNPINGNTVLLHDKYLKTKKIINFPKLIHEPKSCVLKTMDICYFNL